MTRPELSAVAARVRCVAAVAHEAPASSLAITPRVHATSRKGVEVAGPDPYDVGQVVKVPDGSGADMVGVAAANGLRAVEPVVVSQEVAPYGGAAPLPRSVPRQRPRPAVPWPLEAALPVEGPTGGRHTSQEVLDVSVRHRLVRPPGRPQLAVGGRTSDVDAVGDEEAIHAPGWVAANAADRARVPPVGLVVARKLMSEEAKVGP